MFEAAKRNNSVIILLGSTFSFFLGLAFGYIIGDFNSYQYLLEQMSVVWIEVPFVVFFALLARKFRWITINLFILLGVAGSIIVSYPVKSVTPLIFIKVMLTGLVLGKQNWFNGNFLKRFIAVSFPGIILAVLLGLTVSLNDISAETLEQIKKDSLDIYGKFMSSDDAQNAVNNAAIFFKEVFRIGFAIYFIFSLILAWFSFILAGYIFGRFNEQPETLPPFSSFKLPFHAVWGLIACGALWLIGFKPINPYVLNGLAVMAGLYMIQGLAVVIYNIDRISIGRLPKILFWLIFFLSLGFSAVFLIATGIIDNWFKLRPEKIIVKEEGNNDESDS